MTSLVWKDVRAAGKLLLMVIPLGVFQLGSFAAFGPVFVPAALFFTALLAFGSIPVEEMHRTELLWNSLPLSRGRIVGGRYLTVLAGTLLGLTLSLAVGQLVVRWSTADGAGPSPFVGLNAHALIFIWITLVAALYLPFYFKFGAGRGFVLFSAVMVGATLILSAGSQLFMWLRGEANPLFDPEAWRNAGPALRERLAGWIEPRRGRILVLMAGFALSALGFSALVSRRLYEDRDL